MNAFIPVERAGRRLALWLGVCGVVTACGGSSVGSGVLGQSDGGPTGGSSAGGARGSGGSGGSVGLGGSSGSGGTVLSASGFDQRCTYDSECTLVAQGDQCTCAAHCSNAAIATSDLSRWTLAASSIVCTGGPMPCPLLCINVIPVCSNGTCAAIAPVTIDQNRYDRTCTVDSDCHVISTGAVCSECRCSTGAVNSAGYAQYQSDVAAVSCNPGPSVCSCPFMGVAHCALPVDGGPRLCTIGP